MDPLLETEKQLKEVYKQASIEAQMKTNRFFAKFRQLDKIKQEQVAKGELDKSTYLEWRKNKMLMGQRYQDLVNTLTADMTHVNQIAASIVNGHTPEAYANGMNHGTYEVEHGARVNTNFTLYNRHAVEILVRDDPDVIPWKADINVPKDLKWNKQHINNAITQGILQGESIPDVAKRLQSVAQMNNTQAVRTARTAMTAANNAGHQAALKRAQGMGIKLRKQWIAALDGRTRSSHIALDGESVPLDHEFSNGLMYPGDPTGDPAEVYNCRCREVADVEGVDQGKIDDMTLRNDNKLGDMTYSEWKGEVDSVKKPTLREMIEADSAKFTYVQENALLYYADNGSFPKGISSHQKKKLQEVINGYNEGIQGRDVQLSQVPNVAQTPELPTIDQFRLPNETRSVADRWVKDEHIAQRYSSKQLRAMETYMMESDDINGALRGISDYLDYYDPSVARTLSSCMTEYTAPESVYRGVDGVVLGIHKGDSVEAVKSRLVGKSYIEKGFMSTSRAADVAYEFSERGAFDSFEAERPCVLVLNIQGNKVAYLNSGLAEVLLDKGSVITYADVVEEDGVLKIFGEVTQKSKNKKKT